MPNVVLKLTLGDQVHEVTTDKEGCLVLKFTPKQPIIRSQTGTNKK